MFIAAFHWGHIILLLLLSRKTKEGKMVYPYLALAHPTQRENLAGYPCILPGESDGQHAQHPQ
jgi:hypothetical protein